MDNDGADSVHLLRAFHHPKQAWCSGNRTDHHTGRVRETTCHRCLHAASEHYGARYEESWKQVQNLIERQAEVWRLHAPDVRTGEVHDSGHLRRRS